MEILITHTPRNAVDLTEKLEWLIAHPAEQQSMREAACAESEVHHTTEHNYPMLMDIYNRALQIVIR